MMGLIHLHSGLILSDLVLSFSNRCIDLVLSLYWDGRQFFRTSLNIHCADLVEAKSFRLFAVKVFETKESFAGQVSLV